MGKIKKIHTIIKKNYGNNAQYVRDKLYFARIKTYKNKLLKMDDEQAHLYQTIQKKLLDIPSLKKGVV